MGGKRRRAAPPPRGWPRHAAVAAAIALIAAAAWALLSRPPLAEIRRTGDQNILLVTIDTLRADALGAYGGAARTPNLDALAARGLRYDFAHAHAVVTLPSHASILTGRYPFEHGIRDNTGYRLRAGERTAAGLLKARGYATAAFIGAFPLNSRFGLAQGFNLYDDRLAENLASSDFVIAERSATGVVDAARRWISEQQGRWFAWVHVFDPHAPYAPPPPYDREYARSPYHGEVAFTDMALGPLLETAGATARPTLVIVTSDHGEALGEHGEQTHGLFAYEATLRVPLIVAQLPPAGTDARAPRGRVSRAAATHVDILPTLLDAVEADVPDDLPGRTLLDARAGDPERTSYFEAMSASLSRGWAPLEGVLAGRQKYISLPIPEIYDLAADPSEQVNLAPSDPARMRVLDAKLRGFGAAAPAAQVAESSEVLSRLRALGYVSGTAARKPAYTDEDDPKRLVALDQAIHQAIDLYQRGRRQEAAAVYQTVIERRPDMAVAYRHLAVLQWELGEPRSAVATLRRAVERGAVDAAVTAQLGIYLAETGEAREAIPLLETALKERSFDVETLNALGIAHARNGAPASALRAFRAILDSDPDNAMAYENMASLHVEAGNLAAARQALEAAIAINPASTGAHTGLGVIAMREGRRDAALAHWRRAVELAPTNFDALYNLTTELINGHDYAAARPYAEQFVRTAPQAFYGAEIQRLNAFLMRR